MKTYYKKLCDDKNIHDSMDKKPLYAILLSSHIFKV